MYLKATKRPGRSMQARIWMWVMRLFAFKGVAVFHDGLLDMAMWRFSSMGLPIETFGRQDRAGYNSYVGYSDYSPRRARCLAAT